MDAGGQQQGFCCEGNSSSTFEIRGGRPTRMDNSSRRLLEDEERGNQDGGGASGDGNSSGIARRSSPASMPPTQGAACKRSPAVELSCKNACA